MYESQSFAYVFSEVEKEDIQQAIQYAEIDSSCEFKVHVDSKCPGNSETRAHQLFHELRVDQTAARNGILFYLILECRRFIILPDISVEKSIPKDFWDEIYNIMLIRFRKEEYALGLSEAIKRTGEKLKNYFPWDAGDQNEVPDDISLS